MNTNENDQCDESPELKELLNAMCENTITDEQTRRLEEMISADEQAMEFYVQYLWMNAGLERHLGGFASKIDPALFETQPNQRASTIVDKETDMVTSTAQVKQSFAKPRSTVSEKSNQAMYWAVALLVIVAVSIGSYLAWQTVNNRHRQNNDFVKATDGDDPGSQEFVAGAFEAKEVKRHQLADGSILIAHAGTKYKAEQPRQIALTSGDIYLIVAKSDKPFVVKTKDGSITATGTRFTVSTNRPDQKNTLAAVAQGRIVLENSEGDMLLGAGQQGTLVKDQRPTRAPAPRLSYLVNWAKDALKQEELLVEKTSRENGLVALDPWGQQTRLSLRQYNVDVYIEDGIARTTIDQTFFNHNPSNTEGTFYFPLPPDASVSRLAMYVNGELNEGGMVSRQRGQEIYTEILYQRRDPALLEMMEGNMFKMRIFPLEGRQEKRIFLSYTQKLDELYGASKYWFPMDHTSEMAKQLSIRVRVKDGAEKLMLRSSTHDVSVSTDGKDLLLEYAAEKIKPDQDFLLNLLPNPESIKKTKADDEKEADDEIEDTEIAVCEKDGKNYLVARIHPKLTGSADPEPRQWIVLNDVSASRSRIDAKAQRYILERLIAEADDDDSVFLIDLNTQATNVSSEPVNVRTAAAKLLPDHRAKSLIGATNIEAGLKAVASVIEKHKLANPHILYLGDGVATDGEKRVSELPFLIPKGATFVGVGVGKSIDSLFLQDAADRTGGMFVTINPNEDIDWRVFDLLSALNTPRMSNIKVLLFDHEKQAVPAIAYPSSRGLAAGEALTVVARCDGELPDQIVFRGKVGGKVIAMARSLENAKPHAEYIPRLWAKRHIDQLLKSDMPREEEIIELSTEYYVVTPYTSLIVLESDAMYEEYGVERGRKDHWAQYDAPQEIKVVKEPIDWNRWGYWGAGFEGKDAKITANTKPQTVQEIVDNIQVRVNAPFYFWRPQSDRSQARNQLYSLCEQKFEGTSDPSKLLTLWFLLASGQQQAAIDWRKGNQATDHGSDQNPSGESKGKEARTVERIARIPGPSITMGGGFMMPSPNLFWSGGKRRALPNLQMMNFRRNRGLMGWNKDLASRPGYQLINDGRVMNGPMVSTEYKWLVKGTYLNSDGLRRSTSLLDFKQSSQLGWLSRQPKLAQSFQQAVDVRWSRIDGDIKKFNRQYGYYWGGYDSWTDDYNSIDLRKSNAGWNWYGNGLNEILEDFESDEDLRMQLFFSPREANFEQQRAQRMQTAFALPGTGGGESWRADYLAVATALGPSKSGNVMQPVFEKTIMPPSAFVQDSQLPVQSQPGMVSVLAAEYLHKRHADLLQAGDEKSKAEIKAIETAISRIDQAGAQLEKNGMFWGHNAWSYRPQPQTFHAPQVQTFNGYNWSFDLTRYADGLYSNSLDMLDEVTAQFGTPKPLGKIDAATKKLMERARSNFNPVVIRFDEGGTEIKVGPNDRFAATARNSMYLEERMICDGKSIMQFYDELGIAARRKATDMRLSSLRQLVPHCLLPADVLTQLYDVELISNNDQQFTLKLSVPKPESSAKDTDDGDADSEKEHAQHLLITADLQGRVLKTQLIENEKELLTIAVSYTGDQVAMRWIDEKGEELDKVEYQAKPFQPTADTFAVKHQQHVVIDMPLKKPSYYQQKLEEIGSLESIWKNHKPVDGKTGFKETRFPEIMRLKRHQALAEIQDFNWRRWGGQNSNVQKIMGELNAMRTEFEQEPMKGDLVLFGSAGLGGDAQLRSTFSKHETMLEFFRSRHNWKGKAEKFEDEKGLVGHLAHFSIIVYDNKHYNYFKKSFKESPLLLAAAYQVRNQSGQINSIMDLMENDRWAGVAMLLAAQHLRDEQQQKQFSDAFWAWRDKLAKDDLLPALTPAIVNVLRKIDAEKLTEFLTERYADVKKSESVAYVLSYAEQLAAWNETKLADQAYQQARQMLELDESKQKPSLFKRFAYAQSLWAGNRSKQAFQQYQLILSELKKKNIAPSPAMLGATARLAQQAGQPKLAVEFEEQALEAEQPYLPDMINLNAFRQRYQWMWQQYQQSISEIASNDSDPDRESKIDQILERAKATWDRWQEVDTNNSQMHSTMATLLKSVGRDEESWKYLSSIIDQKPRDASSYYTVGQWYRGQSDLKSCERWLAEAPQWDTANPQWLYHHGQVLKELGRKQDANAVFQKIIDGKWAPGLQQWTKQAENQMQ